MNERDTFTRRSFFRSTGAVAGTALLGTSIASKPATAATAEGELPRRVLGRTGLKVTTMTLGGAPAGIARDVSVDEFAEMVNLALDLGINSIDTAPKYVKSEEAIGKALGARRKEIYLATKVWADTIEDAERSLAGSFQRLKTDYVDLLYFHHLGGRLVDKARDPDGVFTWILKQKQAGKCRFVGISGHNIPERFPPFMETGEVDVILVPVNFVDRYIYRFDEKVLPLARQRNIGIVAMKVFGGPDPKSGSWGTRNAKPLVGEEHVELAIRHALNVPGVATANLGVHTAEQLREDVAIVKRCQPPSPAQQQLAIRLGQAMAPTWGPHFGPVDEPPPVDPLGAPKAST